MAKNSGIEWTDDTWNPIVGCSVLSPGCTNCYAMRQAGTRLAGNPKYRGLTVSSKAGPVWTGELRRWKRVPDKPRPRGRPRMFFVNSMSDLFHEAVPDHWIDEIFDVMAAAPQHVYQVLTKRAPRMRNFISSRRGALPPNLWLGVSVEDRVRLPRVYELRATPAAVCFLSLEPLLEDLGPLDLRGIDWAIVGGESGRAARPMHPDWARRVRDQCAAAGVPFFFKQWGEWMPAPEQMNFAEASAWAGKRDVEHHSSGHTLVRVGRKVSGDRLDGVQWRQFPTQERRLLRR